MAENTFEVLNVGTQILTKDIMDQYIRSLGQFRTHYASNFAAAKRIVGEKNIDLLISETQYSDANAYQMITELRRDRKKYLYFILAVDHQDPALISLALDLEADGLLIKPFNSNHIKDHLEGFRKKISNSDDLDLLLFEANLAFHTKMYRKADELFKKVIETYPKNPRAQFKTGMFFLKKSDFEKGEFHLREAVKIDPEYTPAMTALGIYLLRNKDFKQAYRLLTDAQTISPKNPERPKTLSKLHLAWATDILKIAQMHDPGNREIEGELAKLLIHQKEYSRAVQFLKPLTSTSSGVAETTSKELKGYMDLACKLGSIRA